MNQKLPVIASVGGVEPWPDEFRDVDAETRVAYAMPFSPSSVKLMRRCARAWAFDKIDRRRPETPGYMQDGADGHEFLETYLRTGQTPRQDQKMGRVAASGLAELPEPNSRGLGLEVGFMLRSPGGVTYRGYIDVTQLFTAEYPNMAFLGDYKFVSKNSYENYAMTTSAAVLDDDQFAIYAGWLVSAWCGIDAVGANWYYFIKDLKNPKCKPTSAVATREQILTKLDEIDSVARLGVLLRKHYREANQVPHNANAACRGVGSHCQYAEYCKLHERGIQPAALLKKRKENDNAVTT